MMSSDRVCGCTDCECDTETHDEAYATGFGMGFIAGVAICMILVITAIVW